jgi:hypothetical protein
MSTQPPPSDKKGGAMKEKDRASSWWWGERLGGESTVEEEDNPQQDDTGAWNKADHAGESEKAAVALKLAAEKNTAGDVPIVVSMMPIFFFFLILSDVHLIALILLTFCDHTFLLAFPNST